MTLQFPLLFLNGESGWSKGHSKETLPYKSKTINRANDSHVPFPFYCRQAFYQSRSSKLIVVKRKNGHVIL